MVKADAFGRSSADFVGVIYGLWQTHYHLVFLPAFGMIIESGSNPTLRLYGVIWTHLNQARCTYVQSGRTAWCTT